MKGYKNNNLLLLTFLKREFDIDELEDVNYRMIQSYVEYLILSGKKESYVNGLIKVFSAYFKYCEQGQYINRNPMNRVKWQKEEIPMIETYTDNEVMSMVNYYSGSRYLDIRNKLIMVLLFDTGIRNAELCNLKLEDIRNTSIKVYGKGKKVRYVPITAITNKQLIKYLRVREDYIKDKYMYQKEYLLLSQKGKQLTVETLERIVRDCGAATGVREYIRCSPHTCRHYYAQTMLKNGCDIYMLSKLLGHNNINITKRYLNSIVNEDILEKGAFHSPLMNM